MQPERWEDEDHDVFGEGTERDVFPAQFGPGGYHATETVARIEHGLAATTGRDGICSGPEAPYSPASSSYRRLPGRTLRRPCRSLGGGGRGNTEGESRQAEGCTGADESRPSGSQASRPARGPAVQLWIAVLLAVAGLVLLYLGVWLPPEGEIHSSLLVAFGETSTFAGALFGVDYQYRYGRTGSP